MGHGAVPTKTNDAKVQEAAMRLRQMEDDIDRLADQRWDVRSQFSDPREGELLTRWDMIRTPPDILITNYSMLNVMLMRDHEDELFEKTAAWLRADPKAAPESQSLLASWMKKKQRNLCRMRPSRCLTWAFLKAPRGC